jgi:hypothetical protein
LTAIAKLIRHTPGNDLKAYFASRSAEFLESAIPWTGQKNVVIQQVLGIVDQLDDVTRNRLTLDAERIERMTNEVGQAAIMSVVDAGARAKLAAMDSHYARALWLYTTNAAKFEQAADVSFFENARSARTWDGYHAVAGQIVKRDQASLGALEQEIQSLFAEGDVCKAEVFERERIADDGKVSRLIHVSVYRECMPNSTLVFRNKDLDLLIFRPAREVAFTYDPVSGAVEVVSHTKDSRAKLARMFVKHLLGIDHETTPLPIRRINMARFLDPRDFAWDPQDGISSVGVKLLKILPADGRAFITIEPRDKDDYPLEILQDLFGGHAPMSAGCMVYEAILVVQFKPDRVNPRGKKISVRLRHPNGCDLTEKTAKERLLANKYLHRWEIFEDVAS